MEPLADSKVLIKNIQMFLFFLGEAFFFQRLCYVSSRKLVEITIKVKTIVRKPLVIKIIPASSQKFCGRRKGIMRNHLKLVDIKATLHTLLTRNKPTLVKKQKNRLRNIFWFASPPPINMVIKSKLGNEFFEILNKHFNVCKIFNYYIAQSAGAVEYTDCFSADG